MIFEQNYSRTKRRKGAEKCPRLAESDFKGTVVLCIEEKTSVSANDLISQLLITDLT